MVTTPKNLATAQATTSAVAIYTVPVGTTTIVKYISLANIVSTDITVDLIINGRYVLKGYPIVGNGAYREDCTIVIPAGATIQVLSNTATALDVNISGVEVA